MGKIGKVVANLFNLSKLKYKRKCVTDKFVRNLYLTASVAKQQKYVVMIGSKMSTKLMYPWGIYIRRPWFYSRLPLDRFIQRITKSLLVLGTSRTQISTPFFPVGKNCYPLF